MSQAAKKATVRWNFTTFTLIRWQSIRTISKREQLFYIHSQKKKSKKKLKKQISKKNLSATFHIFSKCHFLSNGEGVCSQQAISGHPSQPTLNYRKNMKKKKSKKKIQKKKFKKI